MHSILPVLVDDIFSPNGAEPSSQRFVWLRSLGGSTSWRPHCATHMVAKPAVLDCLVKCLVFLHIFGKGVAAVFRFSA